MTLHKHKLVSSNSSSRLIVDYIEAINKIKKINLDNDELILKSLSFYITDVINKNKALENNDGTQRKNKQTSIKNKVESLVNSDIKNKWNVDNISTSLFMSKSKLYRLLKLDNTCLSSFVLEIRLKNAKKMLLSTDLTISEIALSSGFNSSSYFCKRFKENFYCSPSDFRTISKKKFIIKQTL
ncbi:helix-turn-helix transcriptional regulator [Vibrio alfacsensis]|uniref:helix-turn-helix transcriptional regulator n=1 Tax=Vibrio alfacsensis TaxID=1074311 RepID=UPI002ADD4D1B|nr:helix-turn-helix transcriptional regulator [Vibrio alfacsensis]WQE75845.1 helix-turn-helix transcriptional regulator [Vibrio alfacsensis]